MNWRCENWTIGRAGGQTKRICPHICFCFGAFLFHQASLLLFLKGSTHGPPPTTTTPPLYYGSNGTGGGGVGYGGPPSLINHGASRPPHSQHHQQHHHHHPPAHGYNMSSSATNTTKGIDLHNSLLLWAPPWLRIFLRNVATLSLLEFLFTEFLYFLCQTKSAEIVNRYRRRGDVFFFSFFDSPALPGRR